MPREHQSKKDKRFGCFSDVLAEQNAAERGAAEGTQAKNKILLDTTKLRMVKDPSK